jgi:hypothetical protein
MNIERKALKSRKGEEGAALVMALLVSFLLLALSTALILATSVNSWNFTDATAEQQAYNAAENGIQSVVDVMRYKCTAAISGASHDGCRIKPSPLYATSFMGQPIYEDHKLNKVSFSKAVGWTTSNNASDGSAFSRLSRVLSYSGTGANDPITVINAAASYNAFNLSITDPDNTGSFISYVTQGKFFDHDAGNSTKVTFGSGADTTQVWYTPKLVANLNVPADTQAPTDFGSFFVKTTGAGSPVNRLIRFEINVYMTVPYPATRTIRGYIEPETTDATTSVPNIIFDSQTYNLRGSDFTLDFADSLTGYTAWTGVPLAHMDLDATNPPIGYQARLTASSSGYENKLQGTISPPEPARIRVVATGYGPRGSSKTLEAIILNNYFSSLGAPATLTMVGPPSASNGNFTFNPGNSNTMMYSGADQAEGSSDIIPPVGTAWPADCSADPCQDSNLDQVIDGFGSKIDNTVVGTPANVADEVPPWLVTPAALDQTVKTLYNTALNSYDATNSTGRVFTGTNPTSWGDNASGTGITFCDGDCTLGPVSGGGILIVTGQLTLKGNFDWHGLIIVTGANGILREGGGNGTIEGNIVLAPYDHSSMSDGVDPASNAGFLAPKWDTNGAGNSNILYNSDNQNSGLGSISNNVLGVVEK